jgi:hypothetical protein
VGLDESPALTFYSNKTTLMAIPTYISSSFGFTHALKGEFHIILVDFLMRHVLADVSQQTKASLLHLSQAHVKP